MTHQIKPRIVVFVSSIFAQNLIVYLAQKKYLAGVILPDPSELGEAAMEVNGLAEQMQNASIPFQYCCQSKLPLLGQQFDAWHANMGLVATYPHILPLEIIEYFSPSATGFNRPDSRWDIYNIHTSNLPDYAGPNPIYWQLRRGERETAVVLHRVTTAVDSGNIVAKKRVPIDPLDTLPSLSNRLAYESVGLVAELLDAIEEKGSPSQDLPQQRLKGQQVAPYAHIEDYTVHFDQMTAEEVSAMCRAGNGLPFSAIIKINDVTINLLQATPVAFQTYGTKPGTIIFIGEPEGLIVCIKGGALRLDILAGADGIYSGLAFAERFHLDAGSCFSASSLLKKQA